MSSKDTIYNGDVINVDKRYSREDGYKLYSEWSKIDILDQLEKNLDQEKFDLIKTAHLGQLKNIVLKKKDENYVSNFGKRVNLYHVESEKINHLSIDEIKKIIVNSKTEEKKDDPCERWECEYLERLGTWGKAKYVEKIDTGFIKGNFFYPDHSQNKHFTSARGFKKIKKLTEEKQG